MYDLWAMSIEFLWTYCGILILPRILSKFIVHAKFGPSKHMFMLTMYRRDYCSTMSNVCFQFITLMTCLMT